MNNEDLIQGLIEGGWLRSDSIVEAFRVVDREDFVPSFSKKHSYVNEPIFIGHGQTISQPLVVALMLEMLRVEKGDRVLDIGCGSGWSTALLGHMVGSEGKVFGLEIVPELVRLGQKNISKYNYDIEIKEGNGRNGLDEEAPFDRILISAESDKVESSWKEQLRIGGRMVLPLGSDLVSLEKVRKNKFNKNIKEGFIFVPLVK